MRTLQRQRTALIALLVLACGPIAACGVTSLRSTSSGGITTSTPGSSVVITGAPGTVQAIVPSTATPGAKSAATAIPGAVRLVLDKTAYVPGSSAIVTIENGLGVKIVVTNHHTNCTYVQLEQQAAAGTWQMVDFCKLLLPTLLAQLAPGSVTPQKIGLPSGPEAAGTYRVALSYNGTMAYSSTFNVA